MSIYRFRPKIRKDEVWEELWKEIERISKKHNIPTSKLSAEIQLSADGKGEHYIYGEVTDIKTNKDGLY